MGLSPRLRVLLGATGIRRKQVWEIPASAGPAAEARLSPASGWASSRFCYPFHTEGHLPASAGSAMEFLGWANRITAYPRVCRVCSFASSFVANPDGLSPRLRGLPFFVDILYSLLPCLFLSTSRSKVLMVRIPSTVGVMGKVMLSLSCRVQYAPSLEFQVFLM